MTALEALNLAAPIADAYMSVEERLLVRIARQLSLNDDHQLNEVSKWQLKQLARHGLLRQDAHKIIAAGTKGIPGNVADTVRQAIDNTLAEDGITDMWHNQRFAESAANAVKHYRNQAKDVYNQVNTVMKYKAESTFVRAVNTVADKWTQEQRREQSEIANKQDMLNILNSNTASVVSGAESRTKAVRTTIHEMAQKGIPAFVDKSGREWSPEAYVNMDIRATVKNTALEAQFSTMDSLGQDVFEVSSHPGSRPKCRPWQGKLISRSGKTTEITDINGRKHKVIPLSQTSFGEPDGLFGINCGHRPRGVSDGLFRKSSVEYDDTEDKELYNKVCRQRELERKVRKSKTEADMLEAAGDTEGAKEVRRKMAEQNKALKSYCDNNGLKYRSDRVRTYGSVKPKQNESDFAVHESEIEKAKTAGKGEHPLNVQAINTKEYTEKYNGIGKSRVVDTSVKNEAISIMNHRDGTSFEDLAYIDNRTGVRKFIINNSDMPYGVAHSPECDKFLKNYDGGLIALHNHPGGSRPSYSDIRLAIGYDYKTEKIVYKSIEKSVIAGHNGKVYVIENIAHDENIGKALDKLYNQVYNYYEGMTGNKEYAADKALDAVYAKGKELKAFTVKEM
ncbi:MAG: hypothetical protein J6B57_02860 [Oscillospiraceae bacterium]|nr:hypothetical protein [Oscillospiraceae bacterium]